MVDTVDVQILNNGPKNYIVRLTNISDATGEAAVVKVSKAGLIGVYGTAPARLAIKYIDWSIQGFKSVRLLWDHTTDDEAVILGTGAGERFYDPVIVDPNTAGGTGDLLLTTDGAAAGNTYDIYILLVKLN